MLEEEILKISNDRLCNAYKDASEDVKKDVRKILKDYYVEEDRIARRDSIVYKWIIGIIVVATLLIIISFFTFNGPPILYLDLK